MGLDLADVQSSFDALRLASDPVFHRVVAEGRLRHEGEDGTVDLVDEWSARLICSALRSHTSGAILVVFPDALDRRTPLLFAAALIMDGVAEIEAGMGGRGVLYVANHAGVRLQLGSVWLGSLALDDVFSQRYTRGRCDDVKPVSLSGGVNLPSVLLICAPADPGALLRQRRPKWIAVDCDDDREISWLPDLLGEARRLNIPVVGWTSRAFSGAVSQWKQGGGGVFRWRRQRCGAGTHIEFLEDLSRGALSAEVTPRILVGESVFELSRELAEAAEGLLAARGLQNGRLSADAIALGWRYLRSLESVPVPVDVYDREASSYWGLRRLSDLRDSFLRFLEALRSQSPQLHGMLQATADCLVDVHEKIASTEAPLWLGLANTCVEGVGERRIVFASKARREMFSFCLLARFNISEDDLRDVGVQLEHMGESLGSDTHDAGSPRRVCPAPLLVGIPSRYTERHLESLLQGGGLEVLLWPHQLALLERRVRDLSSELAWASENLRDHLPALESRANRPPKPLATQHHALLIARPKEARAGVLEHELQRKAETVSLWKRPDASEAIAELFGSIASPEDEEGYLPHAILDENRGSPDDANTPWVQEALEVRFDGGTRVLLPDDETVNVIANARGRAEIEQRYVRSLRTGDEILFIQGQRRQSLYELLVSRVHRDPIITQYLALVRRWQDDFVHAFSESERANGITPETVLQELQTRGSGLTSPFTVRTWLRRLVLAPNDPEDLKRLAEVLSLGFVKTYYKQIDKAGKRLKGLHISLSARLNRWLASGDAGVVAMGRTEEVIDAELGLTVEDFRHSLLRLRVLQVERHQGPFYRPHLGQLEGGRS